MRTIHTGLKSAEIASALPNYQVTLATSEQLEEYAARTETALGIRFPLDYLSRSDVLLFVDGRGVTGGGGLIALEPPYRSLESIPAGVTMPAGALHDLGSVAEINGVWLGPECRGSYLSYLFWRSFLEHALATGRKQFLFTYAHATRRIPTAYRLTRPRVLYSGVTRVLPGMKGPGRETVAVFDADILPDLVAVLDRQCGGVPESSVSAFLSRGKGRVAGRNQSAVQRAVAPRKPK